MDITWTCSVCAAPIVGDTGYLSVAYEQITSGGPIRWTAAHDACRSDDGYSVDLAQLATDAQVLAWTAHLAGKTWYDRSDWRAVMAGHGVDVSPEERSLTVREGAAQLIRDLGLVCPL